MPPSFFFIFFIYMTLELAKVDTRHTSLVNDYKLMLEFRHGGQESLHHFAHCRFPTLNLSLFFLLWYTVRCTVALSCLLVNYHSRSLCQTKGYDSFTMCCEGRPPPLGQSEAENVIRAITDGKYSLLFIPMIDVCM